MSQVRRLFVLFTLAAAYVGSKPAPYAVQIRAVDRLFKIAVSESSWQVGLEALKSIAAGHPDSVDWTASSLAEVRPAAADPARFKAPEVRIRAMRRLGETGRQEAIAYLSNVQKEDFDLDTTGQIWPASQVALQNAIFLNIGDRQAKIEFLEKLLRENGGYVASWAGDELCNIGSISSLPLIARSIRQRNPDQYGEDEVRFAEARVRTVTSDPDRVKALASALKVSSNQDDVRLIQWAVAQLALMHTPDAYAALNKYSAAIDHLPAQSAERKNLYFIPEGIRNLREQ